MKRRSSAFLAMLSIATLSLVPATAFAQGLYPIQQRYRTIFGAGGTLLRPLGDFQNNVDWGGGINLFAVFNPSGSVPLGLRVEGGGILYGHETYAVPITPLLPRIALEGTTSNFIVTLGAGPQLTLGTGWLRPYGYGTVGFAYFATSSQLHGASGSDGFGTTTNFDDFTGMLALGGGLLIRMSSGRHPTMLDVSIQSGFSGPTDYLRKGSLIDLPDGSVAFTPLRTRTDMLQFRMGVAVGLGRAGRR